MQITVNGQRVTVSEEFAQLSREQQNATVDEIAQSMAQTQQGGEQGGNLPGPRVENLPAQQQPSGGPTITVGNRQIPMAEYMALPQQERDAIRQQIAQTTAHPELATGGPLDPLLQGATFGFSDEINGLTSGARALVQGQEFWPAYNRGENEAQASLQQARNQSPLGSMGLEIAGAIPTSLAAGGAQAARAGAGVFGQVLAGVPVGVAQGAAYGLGATNNNRGTGALEGAAFGALGGAAAPVAGAALGAGARGLGNMVASQGAARAAGGAATPGASRFLANALDPDDLGANGIARMQAAGGEAMLVDSGDSALNALDYSIAGSGGAGRIAREAIDQRVSRDASALQNALDAALGTPQGANTLRTGIRESTRGARSQAYDAAYSQPIDYSSQAGRQLEELLGRLSQSDIDRANNLMRMEGHQSSHIMADIAEDGSVTYFRQPDVRQIDYITRALNDRAQANAGLGSLGGTTNEGRIFGNLSGDMRDTLRGAVPEYDTALNTGADAIRRSQAVEFGTDLLRRNVPQDDVANWVLRATGPEREAAQQGVRSYIEDTLANVTRTVQDGDVPAREAIAGLRVLSSRANRNKLTALLGTDEATTLLAEVDRIAKSFEIRSGVATNSKTFQRMAMDRTMNETLTPDGPLGAAMRGEPLNILQSATRRFTGQGADDLTRQREAILQSVAQMLTQQSGQSVSTMQALRFLQAAGTANAAAGTGIRRGVQALGNAAAIGPARENNPVPFY